MKRTQILLDEATYEEIRRRASDSRKSIAEVTRELLHKALVLSASGDGALRRRALESIGRFEDPTGGDVSGRHDQYLSQAFGE